MNGSSACTSPMTTPVKLLISRSGELTTPISSNSQFTKPAWSSSGNHPMLRTTALINSGEIVKKSKKPRHLDCVRAR